MTDDFTTAEIETGETGIFVRSHGSGPPILLLHGFPETHLMWRQSGKLQIVAKDDLRLLLGCSSERADAVIQAVCGEDSVDFSRVNYDRPIPF